MRNRSTALPSAAYRRERLKRRRAEPETEAPDPARLRNSRPRGVACDGGSGLLESCLLFLAQARDADAGRAPQEGEADGDPVAHRPRQVRERRDAERARHVGASRRPGEDRLPQGRRVLDRAREVLRVEAALHVLAAEHLARDEEGDLAVRGDADRREARRDRRRDEAEGRAHRLEELRDEDVERTGDRDDAGEGDRAEADEQDRHHRVHAAAVEEARDVLDDVLGVEAGLADHFDVEAVDACDDRVLEGDALEDHGVEHRDRAGHEDHGDRRLLPHRTAQDDDHRQQEQEVPVECRIEGAEDRADLLGDLATGQAEAEEEVDDGRREEGGEGRPQEVADVREQVDAGCHRGDVRRVRQGGELVSEVGARHDCAGDHREVRVHADRDAHEGDADRASGAPGGARAQGDDRGDDEGDDREVLRVDDLQAVVDEHRDRAARHPRADEEADRDEDEDRGHRLRDLLRDRAHDVVPGVAEAPCDQARDDSRGDEEGLDRELGEDVAASQQDDQRDDRDCGEEQARSPSLGLRRGGGGCRRHRCPFDGSSVPRERPGEPGDPLEEFLAGECCVDTEESIVCGTEIGSRADRDGGGALGAHEVGFGADVRGGVDPQEIGAVRVRNPRLRQEAREEGPRGFEVGVDLLREGVDPRVALRPRGDGRRDGEVIRVVQTHAPLRRLELGAEGPVDADRRRFEARDVEGLAGRGAVDDPSAHPQVLRDAGEGRVALPAGALEVAVNVVGEDEGAAFAQQLGEPALLVDAPDPARRIVGVRPQQQVRVGERLLEGLPVDRGGGRGVAHGHADEIGARAFAHLEEGRIGRIKRDDADRSIVSRQDVIDEGRDALDDSGEEVDVLDLAGPSVAAGHPRGRGLGEVVEDLGVAVGAEGGGVGDRLSDLGAGDELHVRDGQGDRVLAEVLGEQIPFRRMRAPARQVPAEVLVSSGHHSPSVSLR